MHTRGPGDYASDFSGDGGAEEQPLPGDHQRQVGSIARYDVSSYLLGYPKNVYFVQHFDDEGRWDPETKYGDRMADEISQGKNLCEIFE